MARMSGNLRGACELCVLVRAIAPELVQELPGIVRNREQPDLARVSDAELLEMIAARKRGWKPRPGWRLAGDEMESAASLIRPIHPCSQAAAP